MQVAYSCEVDHNDEVGYTAEASVVAIWHSGSAWAKRKFNASSPYDHRAALVFLSLVAGATAFAPSNGAFRLMTRQPKMQRLSPLFLSTADFKNGLTIEFGGRSIACRGGAAAALGAPSLVTHASF